MKHLIFFTSRFPYGFAEPFIETELPYLAKAFDRIFIVTEAEESTPRRNIPPKIKVIRIARSTPLSYKIKAMCGLFGKNLGVEKDFIKRHLKLSLSPKLLRIMLGGYARALYVASIIKDIVRENNLSSSSLVLYSYWMNLTAAGIALNKRENPSVTAICRAHGWDVYFERHRAPYLPFRNLIARELDYCCCVSEDGMRYMENYLSGSAKNSLRVSRLGTLNNACKQSGYNEDKLVLVSCSNVIPLKRLQLIIEVLATIKTITIEWTHFGSGSEEGLIKKLAQAKLGSMTNVKYHFSGQVSNASLLDYYASHNIDLFINLSETEGLPVSFMEAGSFGIPVLATDVGGVKEIIKDGYNGVLILPGTEPKQIAKKIEDYYTLSPEKKEQMRKNAFSGWQRNYNADTNYKGFISMLAG